MSGLRNPIRHAQITGKSYRHFWQQNQGNPGQSGEYSLSELVEISGLPEAQLRELVDAGALAALNQDAGSLTFSAQCLLTVRRVSRLRRSFDLDSNALALATSLLERIRDLEEQLGQLHARLPQTFR